MTEQDALDRAAKAAGYADWRKVDGATRRFLEAHANEILARHKAEQALADYKAEVSEAVKACFGTSHAAHPLQRFIIPTPDPLVAVMEAEDWPTVAYDELSAKFRAALAKHGLKLERIDQ